MQPIPDLPSASQRPELFDEGHLWIQELVAGAPLRFRLEPSGRITFAGRERRFDGDPPPSYRHAVRHVREHLDREALLAERADPSAVVFAGVATRHEGIDYDWARLPGFLGTDVHAGEQGLLPPDVVERSFERLGLDPVAAVEKEVQAAYFDPEDYEIPASAWYDGPAAGVVIRNKRGGRAAIRTDSVRSEVEELDGDADAVAESVVTRERVRRAAKAAGEEDGSDLDAVLERVLEAIWREEHGRLPDLDERAFRSAVVERVRERL